MDGPIPCTGHKHGNLLITRIARLPVHTARSRASSPVIRKHLHTVRIDLQPQRRGLVDAVIPPLVRSDYELHAATVPHPGLPSLLLHHVLGGAVQFLGRDQCRGLQQRRTQTTRHVRRATFRRATPRCRIGESRKTPGAVSGISGGVDHPATKRYTYVHTPQSRSACPAAAESG